MFSPSSVDLSSLVPYLCRLLASNHSVLRRSAVSSLRQFAQREAAEVCSYAAAVVDLLTEGDDGGAVFDEHGDGGIVIIRLNYQLGELVNQTGELFVLKTDLQY